MPAVGTKTEVWKGIAHHTSGGLTKAKLQKSKSGKVVSRKQHAADMKAIKHLRAGGFVVKKGQKPLLGNKKGLGLFGF